MKEPLKIEYEVINGSNRISSVDVLKTLEKIIKRVNEIERQFDFRQPGSDHSGGRGGIGGWTPPTGQ